MEVNVEIIIAILAIWAALAVYGAIYCMFANFAQSIRDLRNRSRHGW